MKPSRPYNDELIKYLKNPKRAVGYLNAILEDYDKDAFLLALRHVAEAQGGIARLSKTAKMNRVNLYRILKKGANPEFETLDSILRALGFHLSVSLDKAA